MKTRELPGLLIASALITFDGTAVTTALAAVGKDLELSFAELQWVANASLLTMAALLVPAGAITDRVGRGRTIRVGLVAIAVSSLACLSASTGLVLIAARMVQGAAAAMVLPGALAIVRAAYRDDKERTRMFGRWAAATGLAGAAGPLTGGALVDLISWRAVFATSAGVALVAWLLLARVRLGDGHPRREPVLFMPALALTCLLGSFAYVLIQGPSTGWRAPSMLAGVLLMLPAAMILLRTSQRHQLLPQELLCARNCVAGNAATFSLYFGVFGLSFLLVLYTKQTLGYSGIWSAVGVLPVSLAMLVLAETLGTAATRYGTRPTVMLGSIIAAAGVLWIATAPHPLPFWSRIIVGCTIVGIGASLTISPLTEATVASVPISYAGVASGLNHATARASGLIAIALLGSIAAPRSSELSPEGLARALMVCAVLMAVGGAGSAALLTDRQPDGLASR